MRANKINAAILQCLEHVATGTSPPGAGAADFLLRLLDHDVFSVDEMDEITLRVSTILSGIWERGALSVGQLAGTTIDEISAARRPVAPPPLTAPFTAAQSLPASGR
jgi:hypothetical protein